MQQGRGGMGSHKHGISGRGGPSPKEKLMRAIDENRRQAEEAARKPKWRMFATIAELMRGSRQREPGG